MGTELSGVQAQEEGSELSPARRKKQDTRKEQGADLQPSLSDYGEKENSWEVCTSLLQIEKATRAAGGRAKLIPAESALCSGSECWGFFSPKLFINPFHPLKMDFHLKKVQNLEVPTQHILQALLQPLQFVF